MTYCYIEFLPTLIFQENEFSSKLSSPEIKQVDPAHIPLSTINKDNKIINPLKPELNPMCCLLALLGAHHLLQVSRIRVKSLTFRRLMSYIYIWSTHS